MTDNKIELNDNDKKVIYALLENSRQTAVKLSNKTGLSRQTVNRTIQKLEENNIIWGYYPVINMNALGKKIFTVFLKSKSGVTTEKTLGSISESQKFLREQKSVIPIYTGYFHGEYDWMIMFAADNIAIAIKVVRNWQTKYADTIDDIKLQEELVSFRCGGFLNPNYKEELKNIL
jgi:DNA-binding Lrp family transcriptional regulator